MDLWRQLVSFVRPRDRAAERQPRSEWPFEAGEYRLVNATAPVVVVAAADTQVANDLVRIAPPGLCMIATLRTARDVDALVRNVASNLSIQCLLVTATDGRGPPLGSIVAALWSDNGKTLTPEAAKLLQAVGTEVADELAVARKRIGCVELASPEQAAGIAKRVADLAAAAKRPNTGFVVARADDVERVVAPVNVTGSSQADKAGDFRIHVRDKTIVVEHINRRSKCCARSRAKPLPTSA